MYTVSEKELEGLLSKLRLSRYSKICMNCGEETDLDKCGMCD